MTAAHYRAGLLHVEDIPVTALAARYGTPLYVYSSQILQDQYRALEANLRGLARRVLICHALKATANPTLGRMLAGWGAGADVVSGGEVYLAGRMGFPPERTVFAGVGKTRREIAEGLAAGVRSFHVESAGELDTLAAVAERAQGFHMRVLYYDTQPADPDTEHRLNASRASLGDLLAHSDFVTLHVNYTPETHHLIGASELARMKDTAYLVNTSRGAVVDEADLVDALRNRTIAGAGLDVYEDEPTIHPGLLDLENVVLAPHIASASITTRNAMATMAAENIRAVFAGHRPPNLVNPEVWEDR
jgi:hypothetical protein